MQMQNFNYYSGDIISKKKNDVSVVNIKKFLLKMNSA